MKTLTLSLLFSPYFSASCLSLPGQMDFIFLAQFIWTFGEGLSQQTPPLYLSSCLWAISSKLVPCGMQAKFLGRLDLWRVLTVEETRDSTWGRLSGVSAQWWYCRVAVPPCSATKRPRGPQGLDPGISLSPSTYSCREELNGFWSRVPAKIFILFWMWLVDQKVLLLQ